jgi:hypothetical protein
VAQRWVGERDRSTLIIAQRQTAPNSSHGSTLHTVTHGTAVPLCCYASHAAHAAHAAHTPCCTAMPHIPHMPHSCAVVQDHYAVHVFAVHRDLCCAYMTSNLKGEKTIPLK